MHIENTLEFPFFKRKLYKLNYFMVDHHALHIVLPPERGHEFPDVVRWKRIAAGSVIFFKKKLFTQNQIMFVHTRLGLPQETRQPIRTDKR